MYRRALLASLAPALTGCSLAPSETAPASYPRTRPNVFVSFEWNPDRSALAVTFERGNRLTTENTGRLTVVTPDLNDRETVWVGPTQTDPKASFPLAPGATVTHEILRPAPTRVVWDVPSEWNGEVVARWVPETESGETGE